MMQKQKEHFVMSGTIKKKICWNCETVVTPYEENCSLCGVYLSPSTDDEKEDLYHILTPPYRMIENKEESESQKNSYIDKNVETFNSESLEELSIDKRLVIQTIVFLFLGSIFLLFGAIMFIFSQNGFLTLRWNSDYWFIYLSLAFPLLFVGWRCLHRI